MAVMKLYHVTESLKLAYNTHSHVLVHFWPDKIHVVTCMENFTLYTLFSLTLNSSEFLVSLANRGVKEIQWTQNTLESLAWSTNEALIQWHYQLKRINEGIKYTIIDLNTVIDFVLWYLVINYRQIFYFPKGILPGPHNLPRISKLSHCLFFRGWLLSKWLL